MNKMKGCRPLSPEEIEKLKSHFLSSTNKNAIRDYTLIFLGIYIGFRISELLSIKLKDIYDAKTDKVLDQVYLKKEFTKGKTEGRYIPVSDTCKELLLTYIRRYNLRDKLYATQELCLFPSNRGLGDLPITTRQGNNIFKRAFKECGFTGKLACHTTRKTFAQKCFNRLDRNIVDLQQCLGHKSINSTQSYISFDNERVNNAILEL